MNAPEPDKLTEDGELVISRNGKVVKVKARDLITEKPGK
jgi:hypothetical protein